LNACESASVDPTVAKLPLSIISASPITVRTDSLFGESVGPALELAAEDWNCDGVVTDQEFFDALLAVLERSYPQSQRPALPKLRRQATSEIPLPIHPKGRAACQGVREKVTALAAEHRGEWKELAVALEAQLALTAPSGGPLPSTDKDYYFVDPAPANPDELAMIEHAASNAGLARLPASAVPHASALARFASFAEIYRFEAKCGYVHVFRVADELHVATEDLATLERVLPSRRMVSVPRHLFEGARSQLRILGKVVEPGGPAVPCYEQTGQCFGIAQAQAEQQEDDDGG
jgi:hypothetical protein